ncbi:MAG: photosystem I reaction center subunit VIII [Nostoc sp. ChiSLP01]|nr:photosystem I reaction center subunit VIII [Nostoc sp. CmiSLP01]MDZ8289170.1 photosystem I reaction center subunit VIII [Nostoc sp. ChiSLP01]
MAFEFLPTLLASTSYSASYLSAIFVPIIGWVLPGVVFAFLFLYIESEDIA